ncbi:MAG TPA: alpha/beta hydrolase [Acidimicrobiales bacterium]|nr:alpha/beta hydrolase [Acidimicrobiales bacterium]
MRSEALEGIVTMLRSTAEQRGDVAMTVEEWRAAYDGLGQLMPLADGTEVTAVDAGGVPAEWVVAPEADAGRTVVYFHGGGYCIGSVLGHRAMLSHVSAAARARVLSVGYRLAPEDPHPAALDDAVRAYRWALTSGGADPARTVIGGDSAGGGLTVATLVALRDAGDPLPAAGVCLSPWVDLTQSGATIATKADVDPMVRAEDLGRWADAYRGERDAGDPAVSPLFADLAGLPPLLVDVGTAEVLLDDARRLAERASAAGVDVTLTVAEDMLHVWHFFAGAVPEADEAVARVGAFIAKEAP